MELDRKPQMPREKGPAARGHAPAGESLTTGAAKRVAKVELPPPSVQMKTKGQADYEADVQNRPIYHDGTARKAWDYLGEVEKWSWERPHGVDQALSVAGLAFNLWFGESKVVDDHLEPAVVYHGTSGRMNGKPISRFEMTPGSYIGFWFASKEASAQVFAKKRYIGVEPSVMPVYLRISNPKVYDTYPEMIEDVHKERARSGFGRAEAFRSRLQSQGFDGILIRESDTDEAGIRNDWVAFSSYQIKSATENCGDFDPDNRDICR